MTLEGQLAALADALSALSEQSHHPDEWALINDMHLSVTEMNQQVNDLRKIQKQNQDMER